MATNLIRTSKKLMQALNTRGYNLTFNVKQYIGNDGRPFSVYVIAQSVYDKDKKKHINKDLYSTSSMIRIVFYLRDLWYNENGWELPTDQELWNEIREEIKEENQNG